MADFVLLYSGGSMPETDAEKDRVMKAWDAWYQELGGAIKDGGNHEMSGDYVGIEAVIDYFRRVRRETAGTLQVEPAEILANDRHASIFMRVSAYRDVRWLDVLLAEALTLDPNGSWTEYWALANDQDAVDAFWS